MGAVAAGVIRDSCSLQCRPSTVQLHCRNLTVSVAVRCGQESFTRQVQGLLDRLRNIQVCSCHQRPKLAERPASFPVSCLQANNVHAVARKCRNYSRHSHKYRRTSTRASTSPCVDSWTTWASSCSATLTLRKCVLCSNDRRYAARTQLRPVAVTLTSVQVCLRDAMATAIVTGCLHLVTARSELELASIARLHDRLLHMRHSAEIVRLADVENKARSKTPEVRANGGWDHPFEAPPADGADDGNGVVPAQSNRESGMDASGEAAGTDAPGSPPAGTTEEQPAATDATPDSTAEGSSSSPLKRKPSDELDSAQRRKQKMESRDEDERDMSPRESPRKSRGKSTPGSRGKRNSRR